MTDVVKQMVNLHAKKNSTIDYLVSSPNILPLLQRLFVHEFCPLLSDSHYAVSLDVVIIVSRRQTTPAAKCNAQPKL